MHATDPEARIARILAAREAQPDDPEVAVRCALELCAVLRGLGDPRRADEQARAALEGLRALGHDEAPARLQLGLVALLKARRASAVREVRAAVGGDLAPTQRVLAHLVVATCTAEHADDTPFREALDQVDALVAAGAVDADGASHAERCADRSRIAGYADRARRAYALARRLWTALGDDERAAAMERASSRLS